MGAKLLAIPFGIVTAFILYQIFVLDDHRLSVYLIPLGIILSVIYVFHHQINELYYRHFPERTEERIVGMLLRFVPAFRSLDKPSKMEFLRRLPVFVRQREFIGMKVETIPDDLQALICSFWILLSLHLEEYKLPHYSRIVLYKHPFLSPNYPDTIHVSETETNDGVLIFSMEQLIPGMQAPARHYNIVLHEFARIYLREQKLTMPDQDLERIWYEMEQAGFFSRKQLETVIGLPQSNPYPVLLHHYIQYGSRMKETLPDYFKLASEWVPLTAQSRE